MKKIRKHDIVQLQNGKEGRVSNEARISGLRILEVELKMENQIEYVDETKLILKKQWFWNLIADKL
jgi:hypothetical protein